MAGMTAVRWQRLAAAATRLSLSDTCRIRPNVAATPGVQGSAQSWPSISETVACAVTKAAPGTGSGETPDQTWLPGGHVVVVPRGTTLAEPYRIEWVEGGMTLEVVGEVRARGTDATAVEADCVEVTG